MVNNILSVPFKLFCEIFGHLATVTGLRSRSRNFCRTERWRKQGGRVKTKYTEEGELDNVGRKEKEEEEESLIM